MSLNFFTDVEKNIIDAERREQSLSQELTELNEMVDISDISDNEEADNPLNPYDIVDIFADEEEAPESDNPYDIVDIFADEEEASESDNPSENDVNDNPETADDMTKELVEKILESGDEITELLEKNPELKEKLEKCLDILKNPEQHTPAEIIWALDRIKKEIKGAIFEAAVKEALVSIGLDVESSQRTVEGDTGRTRPDIIAKNNGDKPIIVFGKTIQPGENIYIECKCGRKEYMETQLKEHLPNQLSGHKDGISILVTTSDIRETDKGLQKEVIEKNDTTLKTLDLSAQDIENAIKEAG